MDAESLLNNLTRRGFRLTLSDDRERIVVEPGAKLTDEDCELIKSHKPELLPLLLCAKAGNGKVNSGTPARGGRSNRTISTITSAGPRPYAAGTRR